MTILAVRHERHEGLGLLEKVFEEEKIPFRYLNAFESPYPPLDLSTASALVVLGGAMGVYEAEKYPFLKKEIELLREALRLALPTLGICLGSQLLAAAGGARVYPGPRKEIGWFPIRTRPEARNDLLLKHLSPETTAFHWHGDTFDLPQGASHLASSERYAHQAFRLGEKAWGFQFHLEMTEEMIREWVDHAESKSKTSHPDWNGREILAQTPRLLPEMEVLARKVFGEFVLLAKRTAAR